MVTLIARAPFRTLGLPSFVRTRDRFGELTTWSKAYHSGLDTG